MTDVRQIEILRKNLRQHVGKHVKKMFENKTYGLNVKFNRLSINKIGCIKSIKNSIKNGFTAEEHFLAAENIKELYEYAVFQALRYNRKKNGIPEAVYYFVIETTGGVFAHIIVTTRQADGKDECYFNLYLSKKADIEDD